MVKKLLTFVMGFGLAIGATAQSDISQDDILLWVGSGDASCIYTVSWDDAGATYEQMGLAWGVRFNSSLSPSAFDLIDTLVTYDPRFSHDGTGTIRNARFVDPATGISLTPITGYCCYNINGTFASVGYDGYFVEDGDVIDISESCSFNNVDIVPVWAPGGAQGSAPVPDYGQVQYFVGTGSHTAYLVMHFNTEDNPVSMVWGYRYDGSATAAQMLEDIDDADDRLSTLMAGSYLYNYYYNDDQYDLPSAFDANSEMAMPYYNGSLLVDEGIEDKTLSDGDRLEFIIADDMELELSFSTTFVYVTAPATPVSGDVIASLPFAESFDTYGVHSAYTDPFPMVPTWTVVNNGNTNFPYISNTRTVSAPGSLYLASGYNASVYAVLPVLADGIDLNALQMTFQFQPSNAGQVLQVGVMSDAADSNSFVLVQSLEGYSKAWHEVTVSFSDYEGTGRHIAIRAACDPVTLYGNLGFVDDLVLDYDPNYTPGPQPVNPVEATIAADDILFWVGEGSSEAIMAINWPDTALAWGYRFDGDATTTQQMINALTTADPRLTFVGSGYVDDIEFVVAEGDTLRGAEGAYWESKTNGVGDFGISATVTSGDLVKWGNTAAGTVTDSTYWENWGWSYLYTYEMPIHPVSVPDSIGSPADTTVVVPEHGPFCGIVGTEGCDAIAANSDAIVAWATGCTVTRGPQNISVSGSPVVSYGTEAMATGAASLTDNLTCVSLGDGGSALLTFAHPIRNGEGPDFAVYENSFDDYFLELAFVEVSTDGQRFVRFPATSLTQTETQISGTGQVDATMINNLAGKYRAGYGTPFDLAELADSTGIDIDSIVFVRIVDVVGSIDPEFGSYDAYGHLVNDPFPTTSYSSGFDLSGVAVLYELASDTPVNPGDTATLADATISADDILYWTGTGMGSVVMAFNWADTVLAWGVHFSGTGLTVADAMDTIAAYDSRFTFAAAGGWLNGIVFTENGVAHEADPTDFWFSSLNGTGTSMGMTQILVDGDFFKWGVLSQATGVGDMNEYGYYDAYVFTSAVHAVTAPSVGIDAREAVAFSVYPNPATDRVSVVSPVAAEAVLFDLQGRQVLSLTLAEGANTVDLTSLAGGIYMLRANNQVVKVVKR